ncbi:MAG: porin family protein, partial [Pseudomonadales bacterium]
MDIRKAILGTAMLGLSFSAVAEGGFYAGSGAGIYYVEFDDIDFDESAATLRVFGGYKLNDYLSFEAGYASLFETSADLLGADVDLDGTALDVSVRPTLPLSDNLQAFGIVGWTQYDFDISASLGNVTVSDGDTESDLMYGLGAALDVTDNWNLR